MPGRLQNCEAMSSKCSLASLNIFTTISRVLDEKVPTFFLQPTCCIGGRLRPAAFFVSPACIDFRRARLCIA